MGQYIYITRKEEMKTDYQKQINDYKEEDSIKEKAETIQAEVLKEFEAKKDE